jgi:CMP-2-keto-3-deoxyoctulosonic acid synthetase
LRNLQTESLEQLQALLSRSEIEVYEAGEV